MKLITKTDILRSVPERWNEQYGDRYKGTDKETIYKNLCALIGSDDYTEQQIDETIGNSSWTSLRCWECGQEIEAVAHLGEEPDYESKTFYLCLACLKKTMDLFGI